jgi:DNA-binding protein H-NS
MPRTTSLKSIETQIRRLQERAEKLKVSKKAPAIREIVKSMKAAGITLEELKAAMGDKGNGSRKMAGKSPAKSPNAGKKVAPKYRDPATQATWTGRGNAPGWIKAAEAAGRKREEFLIVAT